MITVTFDTEKERDKKLVEEIEKYKEENKLKSRVEAVRQLCEKALQIKQVIEK